MENSSLIAKKIARKAQSIIETSLVLVAAIIFLLGAFRIGLWYNKELSQRQPAYNATRLAAGSSEPGEWPVYAPGNLTEGWVLEGRNLSIGSQIAGTGGTIIDRNSDCVAEAAALQQQAKDKFEAAANLNIEAQNLDNEAERLDNEAEQLDSQAEALDQLAAEQEELYNQCMATCGYDYECGTCQPYLDQANAYRAQAQAKRSQAAEKRAQASQNRTQANDNRNQANQRTTEGTNLNDQAQAILDNCPEHQS